MIKFLNKLILSICIIFITAACSMSYPLNNDQKKETLNQPTAFTNVAVVPMNDDTILENQTVIIQNREIKRIGSEQDISIPEGALVIDCTGKYLMPGLADMHVHINNEKDLILFLVHGVTTVQNMWGYESLILKFMGFPSQLKLRGNIAQGNMLGPTIYTSGPILEGKPLTHPFMKKIIAPEKGSCEVISQKNKGYDFIKVYDHLDKDVYRSIVQTAKQQNIPIKGHVPFSIGIDGALASGQISIEHLTGYIDPDAAQFLISEDAIDLYAKKTQEAGVWNCPTMVIWQKRGLSEEKIEELEKHPGMKYLSFMQHFFLKKSIKALNESITYEGDYVGRITELDYKMINALHNAGAKLLLGTDCGNPFVFPGWSLHEELQNFISAGLTPYEAIKAGTKNAAEHLGKSDEFGTVEVGKRADLILIDDNPLKDVSNVKKISGVMVGGMWFSKQELDGMLQQL